MSACKSVLTSRGRRRATCISLKPLVLAMTLAGVMGAAQAAPADNAIPTGMSLQAGRAEITTQNTDTGVMAVTQTSDKAVWTATDFSVGAKASFTNTGPSANSDTLIRVIGGSPSEIYGSLVANNRLWLVNASGIYVGSGGSISAASLLMSARDVDPGEVSSGYASFMAGTRVPFLAGAGSNDYGGGFIKIEPGATVTADEGLVMIAPNYIHNQGTLSTTKGSELTLLVGNSAEVEIGDSGYIVLAPLLDSVSNNSSSVGRALYNDSTGVIQADEGHVKLIVAGSGNDGVTFVDSQSTAVTNVSTIRVNGVLNRGIVRAHSTGGYGRVQMEVKGDHGSVDNQGTINVSALGDFGFGGTIDMVASSILVGSTNADVPASLLADGPQGGGQINLVSMANSQGTSEIQLNGNTLISANATGNGNGGGIAILGAPNVNSDTSTSLAAGNLESSSQVWLQGVLRAQGGSGGGDGGRIVLSGSMVNTRLTGQGGSGTPAQFDVSARSTTGKAGTWSLYSPQVLIGNAAALANSSLTTLVFDEDLSTLLNTGANVKIGTYADAFNSRPSVAVQDGTVIQSGFDGAQELAIESVDSVYLGEQVNGANIVIEATKGPMAVKLTADSDRNGVGDLVMVGTQQPVLTAVPGRATAQASTGTASRITTLGGDITLTGRSLFTSGSASSDAVLIKNVQLDAGTGNVSISGLGGVTRGEGTAYFNGVDISDTDIYARDISIVGGSLAATGVSLNNVQLHASQDGTINVVGYSAGLSTEGDHVGVDAQNLGVELTGAGKLKMAGYAEGGAGNDGVGLRIGYMDVGTTGQTSESNAPRITLAGQSDLSTAPGLEVNGGVTVYLAQSEGGRSTADLVIGAKASSPDASEALTLGNSRFYTTGHIDVRPMTVDKNGALGEDVGTAIHIGYRPDVTSFPTNFFVSPDLFNGNMGMGLNVIVGSSLHSGRITTDRDVFLDPTATATLQNQGAGSGGIDVAKQGGDPIILLDQAGRAQALAVDPSTTTSAGTLNLVSGGAVTQSGPIAAQVVNVVTSPQAAVTLNDPGNQIGSMLISGGAPVSVTPGATPSSTGSITVFDASANQFRTINATSNRADTPDFEDAIAPSIATVESSDALNELRTDVYVRGQFSRPQVCTPANTGGVSADQDADPLALQWLQVRRSAQLSSCSSVRNDSNCSAF